MPWWGWLLLAWIVGSPVAAWFIGRIFSIGKGGEE